MLEIAPNGSAQLDSRRAIHDALGWDFLDAVPGTGAWLPHHVSLHRS